ncbi:hypothetical protein [Candidatus Nitrotoga sp. M5]|uniref:hypothetical protein n=1 Tax=Candidatus Nitrotoga sp. M5 TaxID=2890409 RepID=UPI001EF16ECB|nr:hypothetical protein [Candidatus Nitrotoga sp. M5]CAH1385574.1 conserved exported hypothetical protein [Candidatus Nitrotoga sp. M5]
MLKKPSSLLGTVLIITTASFFSGNALAASKCFDAKGSITNNAQPDGSTLGVAAVNFGGEKLKCALKGDPQAFGGPDFKHTMVCDNKTSDEEAQAQVTFDTSFLENPLVTGSCPAGSPGGPISFSFIEKSIPDPSTARGAFVGITNEHGIIIKGKFNCMGGITMKFKGKLCFSD